MTIEKGQTWGERWSGSQPVTTASDDAALARLALAANLVDTVAVLAPGRGDLLKTIGLDEPRTGADRHRYPIDLVIAHLAGPDGDETLEPFVAHLTVPDRRFTGFGPGLSVAVMNAAWLGDLRLGPRAHPNDGLIDVTEGTVGLLQRREADRRARTGSHLPHPGLRATRAPTWERTFDRPVPVRLDGVARGHYTAIRVEVVPDALAVVA